MLAKTNGIVINSIKYRETSIIVKIFTEKFGLQSYLVNGIRSSRSKLKIGLFQPMTLLELVVYHKDNGGIQRLSEAKCTYQYQLINKDIVRSAIVIFINEILGKTLREGSNPEEVFPFLAGALVELDSNDADLLNFHLLFLIRFAKYLGFSPSSILDFIEHLPPPARNKENSSIKLIHNIIENKEIRSSKTDNETRREALNLILIYYRTHLGAFSNVKSVEILKEILG